MADEKLIFRVGADTSEAEQELTGLSKKIKDISVGWGVAMQEGGKLLMRVLGDVTSAFLDTNVGIKNLTAFTELYTQSLYNLTQGIVSYNATMWESLRIAKEINFLREDNREDLKEEAKLQSEFNRLYFESVDRGKDDAERMTIMNDAIKKNNELYDAKIQNVLEDLGVTQMQLVLRPKSNKLLDQEAELQAELIRLDGERYSSVKRLQSQLTSLQAEQAAELAKWKANWQEYFDWIDEKNKEADSLAAKKRGSSIGALKVGVPTVGDKTDWFRGWADFLKDENKGALAKAPELAAQVEGITRALIIQNEAVGMLSAGFQSLFSSTGNGFQEMMNTIIAGIQRLVAELLAKTVMLSLMSLLGGGGLPIASILSSVAGINIGGGKKGWGFSDYGIPAGPTSAGEVVFKIAGKDMVGKLMERNSY